MIKYKLYTHSGVMHIVPLDKYEYVDNTVGRYFEDYCAGLLTLHEFDRFVEECIIDNGGNDVVLKFKIKTALDKTLSVSAKTLKEAQSVADDLFGKGKYIVSACCL